MDKHTDIRKLLEKHLNRDLTASEARQLFDQLKHIKDPEGLDDLMRQRWNVNVKQTHLPELSWAEIVEEKNKRATKSHIENKRVLIRQMWQWGVAASLTLMVSLAVWWTWESRPDYLTYTTGFGETRDIVLNDGTAIILNANSRLTWKNDWKNDTVRYAELEGEAFFDVAHVNISKPDHPDIENKSARLPFRVQTSDLLIDVLGTTFNVADRRGETKVYLESGSIQLGLLDSLTTDDQYSKDRIRVPGRTSTVRNPIIMEPGESLAYSARSQKLKQHESETAESMTEWKDGTLAYHDIDFKQMLEHLEDIYGKHFEVLDQSLLDTKVSIGVPYKDWNTVKSLMELTLQLRITTKENDQVLIQKK